MSLARDKELVVRKLKAGAEIVAAQARRNAAWSKRIRSAIRVEVNSGAVTVIADGNIAPQSKAFEGKRGRGIRHPLNFPAQTAKGEKYFAKTPYRPFMSPAWDEKRDEVADLVADGMKDALNEEMK